MFNKTLTDNHNLRKNVTTNEKQILKKVGLNFHKIAFYMCFAEKWVTFWSYKTMRGESGHYKTTNSN